MFDFVIMYYACIMQNVWKLANEIIPGILARDYHRLSRDVKDIKSVKYEDEDCCDEIVVADLFVKY